MAEELHIYDGSQYRQANEVHVYDGSQYRQCTEVHVWDGSAWRQIFSSVGVVTLTNQSISYSAASNPIAGIRFNSDGTVDKREGSTYTQISEATDWIIPNASVGSQYQIRWTNVSSTGSGGRNVSPPIGGWQGIYGGLSHFDAEANSGTYTTTFTVEIRDVATETVQDSATITLSSTKT